MKDLVRMYLIGQLLLSVTVNQKLPTKSIKRDAPFTTAGNRKKRTNEESQHELVKESKQSRTEEQVEENSDSEELFTGVNSY